MEDFKKFWNEEEGLGTVEMVLLLAALVSIALMMRMGLLDFMKNTLDKILKQGKDDAIIDKNYK